MNTTTQTYGLDFTTVVAIAGISSFALTAWWLKNTRYAEDNEIVDNDEDVIVDPLNPPDVLDLDPRVFDGLENLRNFVDGLYDQHDPLEEETSDVEM